jgi:hypothetical protein
MVEFWRMLRLFLGFGAPRREEQVTTQEGVAHGAMTGGPAGRDWAIGFETVLPGMSGVQSVPVGPGRNMVFHFGALTVLDSFQMFDYMVQLRQQWPSGPDGGGFAGYVALEGPGWNMTVYFPGGAPRVEYFAGRSDGGARVSGQVRWELLAQALVLCPDYDAVVGYLTLSPYHMGHRPV